MFYFLHVQIRNIDLRHPIYSSNKNKDEEQNEQEEGADFDSDE